jgi:sialic acid synthase SpsE
MAKIILDFGSGNTHRNSKEYIKRMHDELKAIDTGKHEIIIKHQLFENWYSNVPLSHESFDYAYDYGTGLGYKVTSSVFDKPSLDFLLQFDVPFIKIANRRELDWLIGEIPRKIPAYVSYGKGTELQRYYFEENHITPMWCVSEYPADIEQYDEMLEDLWPQSLAISDHTTNFGVWYRYRPTIIEWHYGLSDSTGLDAGPFMRTPEQLVEVL